MMRVALYARVSTSDQDSALQLPQLRELAACRGYEVVREYADSASGRDQYRPAFQEMMDAASRREFDAIMATRVDRVMRSVVNLDVVLQQLEVYNVRTIFGDLDVDLRSPSGRLVLNVVSSIAQWEREIISARTADGMQARKARGQKFGRRPRDDIPVREIAVLRNAGSTWSQISKVCGIPRTTLLERRTIIEDTAQRLLSEMDPASLPMSETEGVA